MNKLNDFVRDIKRIFLSKYKQPHWLVAYIEKDKSIGVMTEGMSKLTLEEIDEFFDSLKTVLERSRKGCDHDVH